MIEQLLFASRRKSSHATIHLRMDGPLGSKTVTDLAGNFVFTPDPNLTGIAANGVYDQCMQYSGNGGLYTPDHPLLTLGNNDFTIAGWARTNGAHRGLLDLFCKGSHSNGHASFVLLLYNGYPCFWYSPTGGGAGPVFFQSATVAPINTWLHLAFTRKNGMGRLFVNGILVRSGTVPNIPNAVGQPLTLGRGSDGIGSYNSVGFVDELFFLNGECLYTENFVPTRH